MSATKRLSLAAAACVLLCGSVFAVDFNSNCYGTTNHEVFTSAFQRFVTAKSGKGDVNKTTYKPTAGLLGYRYSTPQWSAGVAVSYENGLSKNRLDDGIFRMREETLGVSLFGRYNGFSGWYAQSSFFTGFNRTRMRDGVTSNGWITPDGREKSTLFAATLELGKTYDFGEGTRITPHAGFNFSSTPGSDLRFAQNGNRETWNIKRQNYYEIPLGVTFAKDFYARDWVVTPSVDLTMIGTVGNMNDENYNVRSGFAAYDGSKWQVHGVGAGHWGGRVTAGINAIKSEKFDVGVSYAYEGRKKYSDHRITAGIGFKF